MPAQQNPEFNGYLFLTSNITDWRYSLSINSGTAQTWHPADAVTTTYKPVTLYTRSKNSTLTRHPSLTHGNPFITKIKRHTNINTIIYKTESTLLHPLKHTL